jgi:hypothetical protein
MSKIELEIKAQLEKRFLKPLKEDWLVLAITKEEWLREQIRNFLLK